MAVRGLTVKKGDVYGELVALEDDEVINTRRYVLCRCSCGTEKKFRVDALVQKGVKSCGCLKSPKIEQLIGKKFGHLTIIGKAEHQSRKSVLCKCDCGKIVSKHQDKVLNGTRTSCGRCNYQQVKIGDVFGKWTVIGDSIKSDKGYHLKWLCQCSCEKKTIAYVDEQSLKRGVSKSCGCETIKACKEHFSIHGNTGTRLYTTWVSMHGRCNNPNNLSYNNYGGRGIKICHEWDDYITFRDWALNNGYADDLTIERIDNDGNYEPSNCRWATILEQANNKRNNLKIYYNNEVHTASEWSRRLGISADRIRSLYHKGYTLEEIIKKQKGEIA